MDRNLANRTKVEKDLVFLLLQYLNGEKYQETVHKLEQESGYFFNMKYFEEKVLAADWDEVEKYLSGFTDVLDNSYSTRIFFEIRKQKYLEALDVHDKTKAENILVKDLKVFSTIDENLYKDAGQLSSLENIWDHELLAECGGIITLRTIMLKALKRLIEVNPAFQDKLVFPTFKRERLRTLINQSLNWQHQLCEYQLPNPHIETLFTDHMCAPTNRAHVATPVTLPVGAAANPAAYCPLPPTAKASNTISLGGTNATVSSSARSALVNTSSTPTFTKSRTPSSTPGLIYCPNNDRTQRMKRLHSAQPLINEKPVDTTIRTIKKSRTLEDAPDEGKSKELAEIVDPSKCQVVTLPTSKGPATTGFADKVARLLYTNSGQGILALGYNGIQKLWVWSRTAQNPSGKATASVVPQHWQPEVGRYMTNDVSNVNLREAVPCIALSNKDKFGISSCGGELTVFINFKAIERVMALPPVPTFLAFHPQDSILFIGMEDSTIHIYNLKTVEVKSKLKGHQKRITGLAFSTNLNILVSSGADNQLCAWNGDTWEKGNTITIQVPAAKVVTGQTQIHFHSDQVRLLVFCETQLAIYDASKMECIQQWVPDVLSAPVSCAAYSCNSQVVYAAFYDGNVGVFDAESLRLRCRIAPAAYLSPAALNSQNVGPLVIATHPEKPNQFAIGMIDGTVKVLEPSGSDGWCVAVAPSENGMTTPSGTSNLEPD